MANFKIDHFVFGAKTLNEGSKVIKNILNEDLSEINVHETMGTHKRVISLETCYLEVISLDPENQNIVNEAQQIINSGAPVPKHTKQQMQSKMELKSTRDRLRKKLEEKKKRLQEKQERENKPKIEEVKEEIDLDALADEIEGL